MLTQLISGFLAGLATGIYCLGACLPIFVPLMLAERQNLQSTLRIVIEFSLGRLTGYLLFGLLVGYLGEAIKLNFIHQLVAIATITSGLLLFIYSLGFLKWSNQVCKPLFKKIKLPLILGFLTGVNICPPFLASLTYVFNLENMVKAASYFLAFFIGTSLYIIPVGSLAFFSDDLWLQKLARLSGIFVGGFFIYKGIIILL